MQFPRWLLLIGIVFASSLLIAQQQMQVTSSVPLPDFWKRMGSERWVSCGANGDLTLRLIAGVAEQPHEMVRIAANGAMLGYFDLHRTQGFENGTIADATLDSAGRIVLLVRNLLSADMMKTDDEGHPRGVRFRIDRTLWILTVDDDGKILDKFSFDQRVVMGLQLVLFRSGNLLVTGNIQEGQHGELIRPGAIIFSPAGAVLANLKLPVTAGKRPPEQLRLLSGGGDEVFLAHLGTEAYLLKVSADGTVGPKVMLAVPTDEQAFAEKIAGHRALASIAQAERLHAGTIRKAPDWHPKAVFDTESGALLETLLVPQHEMGPVCYSESGMTFIRTPEGTLDTLVAKPAKSY